MNLYADDWKVLAVFAVAAALLVFLISSFIEDGRKWEAFKVEHNCKVTANIKGDVFNTFGNDSKGNMTVGIGTTPNKTGWLCDDGITYFR